MNNQIKTRTATNFQVLTNSLYPEAQHIHSNHWQEGLLFLQHHALSPPTFRQTLITKINHRLERRVLNTYHSILESCIEAHKQSSDNTRQFSSDFDPTPIWKLPFIFERLVLGPNPAPPNQPKKNRQSINQIISRRLSLFQSGQLQVLFDESNSIKSKTRKDFTDNPVDVQQAAQLAADLDNPRSAYARLVKHMPVASIDDDNIDILHKLHPRSLNLLIDTARRPTRQSTKSKQRRKG